MRKLALILVLVAAGCIPKDGGWASTAAVHRAPLTVSSQLDGNPHRMLERAIEEWNDAAGCTVFSLADGGNVVVEYGSTRFNESSGARIDGEAWAGGAGKFYVRLNAVGTITTSYLILAHELGHVLGLAHDRSRMSVMRSGGHAGQRDMSLDRGAPWPIVSHQDRALVSQRYCKRGSR